MRGDMSRFSSSSSPLFSFFGFLSLLDAEGVDFIEGELTRGLMSFPSFLTLDNDFEDPTSIFGLTSTSDLILGFLSKKDEGGGRSSSDSESSTILGVDSFAFPFPFLSFDFRLTSCSLSSSSFSRAPTAASSSSRSGSKHSESRRDFCENGARHLRDDFEESQYLVRLLHSCEDCLADLGHER